MSTSSFSSTGNMNLKADHNFSVEGAERAPELDNAAQAGVQTAALQPSSVNRNVEKPNKRRRSTSPEDEDESGSTKAKVSRNVDSHRNPLAERRGMNMQSIHTDEATSDNKENLDPSANVVTPAGGLLSATNRSFGQHINPNMTIQHQQLATAPSGYALQAASMERQSRSNTPAEAALAQQTQQNNYIRLLLEQQMRQQQSQLVPLANAFPSQQLAPPVVTPSSTLASASTAFFPPQTAGENNVNSSPAQNLRYLEFQHQQLLESQRQVRLQQQQYQQMAAIYQAGLPTVPVPRNMTPGGSLPPGDALLPSMSAGNGQQLSPALDPPFSHASGLQGEQKGFIKHEATSAPAPKGELQQATENVCRGTAQVELPKDQQSQREEPTASQGDGMGAQKFSSSSVQSHVSTASTAQVAPPVAQNPLTVPNTVLHEDSHPSVVAAVAGAIAQTYQQAAPMATTTKKSSRKQRKNMGSALGQVYLSQVSPTEDQTDGSIVPGSLMMPQTPLDVNLLPAHARPSWIYEPAIEAGMFLPQVPMDLLRQREERMRSTADLPRQQPDLRENSGKCLPWNQSL